MPFLYQQKKEEKYIGRNLMKTSVTDNDGEQRRNGKGGQKEK